MLWIGAFLSFTGGWVQVVAQGWLVFDLTKDEAMLGLITFCGMAPVSILGPFAGTLTDTLDRRKLLIFCQTFFGLSALTLGTLFSLGIHQFWHIAVLATAGGIVGSFEMPTRQSLISKTVPPEDLAAAIPLNAMTFNGARLIGPAIGGFLLARYDADTCYFVNAVSYFGLIFAALAIRADLSATKQEPMPIGDLLLEGMRFIFRDRRLKTLFIMEAVVSSFGLVYLSQMPAFAQETLGMAREGIAVCFTWVGVGAVIALIITAALADHPRKDRLIGSAMLTMALALILLSFVRAPLVYPLLAFAGGAAIIQFNTTNALFQTMSPERLRGRVIAMHVWALAGAGPFGSLLFGWIARQTKIEDDSPFHGIPLVLMIGGLIILAAAVWGFTQRKHLRDLAPAKA